MVHSPLEGLIVLYRPCPPTPVKRPVPPVMVKDALNVAELCSLTSVAGQVKVPNIVSPLVAVILNLLLPGSGLRIWPSSMDVDVRTTRI